MSRKNEKDKTLSVRIGILSFAHMHAASYAGSLPHIPGATLVGIADEDRDRATRMATQFGTTAYPSYEALLADVDAVVICSENVHHRRLTELAAKAQKHVLCEKPLATTLEDADAMIAICAENGVKLFTAFPCRFHPAYKRLKAATQEGAIGQIIGANTTNQGQCPGGWFIDKKMSGGGAAIDHTVHVTDLLRDMMGAEPVEVYAELTNGMAHSDYDDCALITITFDNGVFATLDASWSRPKSFWTWGNVKIALTGTEGVASMDMFAQNHVVFSDVAERPSLHNWGDNMDLEMIQAFVDAVAGTQDLNAPVSLATGEDGRAAARVALAAYRAAETGQPVTL